MKGKLRFIAFQHEPFEVWYKFFRLETDKPYVEVYHTMHTIEPPFLRIDGMRDKHELVDFLEYELCAVCTGG